MNIEFITREDLIEFQKKIVSEVATINQQHEPKKWLRSKEVREMLNISPGTLQNMRINGTIPYSKIGSTLFYSMENIQRILEDNMSN